MAKLIICRGLPASGKTTWAKQFVQNEFAKGNKNVINVDRDIIRTVNGFGLKPTDYESTISMVRNGVIRDALKKNFTVIESSTNLRASYVKELAKIAEFFGAEVEVRDFTTSLATCIHRDAVRGFISEHRVGERVIIDMHKRYFVNGQFPANPLNQIDPIVFEPYVRHKAKSPAYLCDIDGTVAKMNGRSPYDYTRVSEDLPQYDVIGVIGALTTEATIIFLSGREDSCMKDTKRWLKNNVGWTTEPGIDLFMRKTGDGRQDAIVKYEIFKKHIEPHYNVLGVFDDRKQVCDMWRSIGLRCYNVAEGDF